MQGSGIRAQTCSVVIPAHNVEQYVADAIDSVLKQTHPATEVIVVNDGSTDGTADVVHRYGNQITYIEQENRGLAGARNAGLGVASGDLIGLLDADDMWLPERLERCLTLLADRPEVGFVTTDAWLIDGATPTQERFNDNDLTRDFPETNQLARFIRSNVFFASVVARRELYDRHGWFDESLRRSEDYDMWLRFLAGGEVAARIEEPLAHYRVRSDSLSADQPAQRAAHRAVLEKQLHAVARIIGSGFGHDAWDVAVRCARRGDDRAASRFFMLAARDRDLPLMSRARAVGRAAVTGATTLPSRFGRR